MNAMGQIRSRGFAGWSHSLERRRGNFAGAAARKRSVGHTTFATVTSAVLVAAAFAAFGVPALVQPPLPKPATVTIDFHFLGKDYALSGSLAGQAPPRAQSPALR